MEYYVYGNIQIESPLRPIKYLELISADNINNAAEKVIEDYSIPRTAIKEWLGQFMVQLFWINKNKSNTIIIRKKGDGFDENQY